MSRLTRAATIAQTSEPQVPSAVRMKLDMFAVQNVGKILLKCINWDDIKVMTQLPASSGSHHESLGDRLAW